MVEILARIRANSSGIQYLDGSGFIGVTNLPIVSNIEHKFGDYSIYCPNNDYRNNIQEYQKHQNAVP